MTSQRIKQEVKPVDFFSSYPLFNLELVHYPSIIIYQFSSKKCKSMVCFSDFMRRHKVLPPQLSWLFQKTLTSSMYHKPNREFLCKPQLSDFLNQLYQIISTINPHCSWFFITLSVSFPNKHGRVFSLLSTPCCRTERWKGRSNMGRTWFKRRVWGRREPDWVLPYGNLT